MPRLPHAARRTAVLLRDRAENGSDGFVNEQSGSDALGGGGSHGVSESLREARRAARSPCSPMTMTVGGTTLRRLVGLVWGWAGEELPDRDRGGDGDDQWEWAVGSGDRSLPGIGSACFASGDERDE